MAKPTFSSLLKNSERTWSKLGTKREQLVERPTSQIKPETWDLIRRGDLSHVLCKVGDELSFFSLLNAPSLDVAKALVERSAQRLEAFEVDIYPVKHFPHFD